MRMAVLAILHLNCIKNKNTFLKGHFIQLSSTYEAISMKIPFWMSLYCLTLYRRVHQQPIRATRYHIAVQHITIHLMFTQDTVLYTHYILLHIYIYIYIIM